jgi:hypothetical protein
VIRRWNKKKIVIKCAFYTYVQTVFKLAIIAFTSAVLIAGVHVVGFEGMTFFMKGSGELAQLNM